MKSKLKKKITKLIGKNENVTRDPDEVGVPKFEIKFNFHLYTSTYL